MSSDSKIDDNKTYNLADLARRCHDNSRTHGFWDTERNKGEMIALEHSELSERLEAIRTDAMSEKLPGYTEEEEEVADEFIRLCDYAVGHNLRLLPVIWAKMEYNAGRPRKHGKKF